MAEARRGTAARAVADGTCTNSGAAIFHRNVIRLHKRGEIARRGTSMRRFEIRARWWARTERRAHKGDAQGVSRT